MRLAKIRKARGWTQQKLADETGVCRALIAQVECGDRRAYPSLKRRIAEALEVEETGGKTVGYIENGTAHKRVQQSKHFFRKLQSWSLDLATWRQIETSCHSIVLHDIETDADYFVTVQDFDPGQCLK